MRNGGRSMNCCLTGRGSLDAGLAVFLTELLESEGGLADTGLGGLVVNLVDVLLDSSDLLFDLGDNSVHCFVGLRIIVC